MKKLKSSRLIAKASDLHGYGVFAGQPIARGDLIEECTTIQITDTSILKMLSQGTHHLCNYIHKMNNEVHILLGHGSLYNHANKPNAEVLYNPRLNVMQIWALDTIERGQEILMYYGNEWSTNNQERIIVPKEKSTMLQTLLRLPLAKTVIVVTLLVIVLKLKMMVSS